jgi:hypothetical protein
MVLKHCKVCKKFMRHHGKGLCNNCYNKQYIRRIIKCQECKQLKPHHAKRKCHTCYARKSPKYWREYYKKNKVARQKASKKYYEKNKKNIIIQHRKYYHKKRAKGEFPYDVQKRREYERRYNKEKPEIIKEISKRTYKKNKEKIKVRNKKYYEKNRLQILRKRREYVKKTNYYSKYYYKNKEKEKRRYKEYCKTPQGRYSRKLSSIKRWTLERQGKFDLTKKDIINLFKRDKVCVYCGLDKKLELDHIISVYNGGDTTKDNMVVSCRHCNASKNRNDVFDWCEQHKITVPKIIKQKVVLIEDSR